MPPTTRKKTTIQTDAGGTPPAGTIRKAIEELKLDRPFYTCKVIGNRLEFSLYGGDIVYWPLKHTRSRRGGS